MVIKEQIFEVTAKLQLFHIHSYFHIVGEKNCAKTISWQENKMFFSFLKCSLLPLRKNATTSASIFKMYYFFIKVSSKYALSDKLWKLYYNYAYNLISISWMTVYYFLQKWWWFSTLSFVYLTRKHF